MVQVLDPTPYGRVFLPAALAAFLSTAALGGEQGDPTTPIEPAPLAAAADMPFDIAVGIALTTNYVSRGITNSNSEAAVQGYVEPSVELGDFGTAYVNVWSSNVDYGEGFEGYEIDVAGGFRPTFGPLSLDVGYVHYFYSPEHVSPDYGEVFAKADYNFDDKFTIGGRVFYAPDFNQSDFSATWVAAGVRVPLPNDFSAYAGVGYQFFENSDAFEQLAWMAGVSYSWKAVTIDVRYWDTDLSDDECITRSGFSNGCDATIVGTLSFDTSFSEIRDWMSGP